MSGQLLLDPRDALCSTYPHGSRSLLPPGKELVVSARADGGRGAGRISVHAAAQES